MRPAFFFGIVSLTCSLFSCASVTVGDIRLSGQLRQVSVADIQSVIEVDRLHSTRKIYEIEVVSREEIHIWHDTRARTINVDIVRRTGDRWSFIKETGFVT